jgi:predicted DNA-binding transcriptional regulator AlpA
MFLNRAGLKARGIPCDRHTTIKHAKAGTFPKPVKISGRNFWLKDEIDAWQQALLAERDGVPA